MIDSGAPLLTVVTVTRDDETGFQATCDSLCCQSSIDDLSVEWIVVDGSTDASRTRATLKAAETRMTCRYEWTEPEGIYRAMNVALRIARGKFIMFLNSGDILAGSEVLQSLIAELGNRGTDELTWLVARVVIRDRRNRTVVSPSWDYQRERQAFFARGLFPPHQGTVVRTNALRSLGGFDSRYTIAADYHAALRLSQLADPIMSDEIIAEFREGGVSTTNWRDAARQFHRARQDVYPLKGIQAMRERWFRIRTFIPMFIYRDVLRRDQ